MAEFEEAACSIALHRKRIEKERESQSFGKVATSEDKGEIAKNGAFVRQKNRFCTPFGDKEGELPVGRSGPCARNTISA